jgi:hypothetical protein
MCSLEEAWGNDYKAKYGATNDSTVYFSNSGLHEDYNTTPDNLFNQGQNLPAPAVSKTVRMPANRRLSSVDCKKDGILPRSNSGNVPGAYNSCTMPMSPLDNGNLEANMLPCTQQKFESTDNNMRVNYPHWNHQSQTTTKSDVESHNVDTSITLYQQHQEILDMLNALNEKMDRLEQQMGGSPRNLNDMILYIIVGMMISLVIYLILNKLV